MRSSIKTFDHVPEILPTLDYETILTLQMLWKKEKNVVQRVTGYDPFIDQLESEWVDESYETWSHRLMDLAKEYDLLAGLGGFLAACKNPKGEIIFLGTHGTGGFDFHQLLDKRFQRDTVDFENHWLVLKVSSGQADVFNDEEVRKTKWRARQETRIFVSRLIKHLDPEINALLKQGNQWNLTAYNVAVSNTKAISLLRRHKWVTFRAFWNFITYKQHSGLQPCSLSFTLRELILGRFQCLS